MTHGPSPRELLDCAPKPDAPPQESKTAKGSQQREGKPGAIGGDPFAERFGEKFAFAVVGILIMVLVKYMGW